MDNFERSTPKSLSLEALNDLLFQYEAMREAGPFLKTFERYLLDGRYTLSATKTMCATMGARIMDANSPQILLGDRDQRHRQSDYQNMYAIGEILAINVQKAENMEAVLELLRNERARLNVEGTHFAESYIPKEDS